MGYDRYCIQDGYKTNNQEVQLDLTQQIEDGIAGCCQQYVYEAARAIATCEGYKNVLDIGTGSGFKLVEYFSADMETLGTEVAPNYDALLSHYPDKRWMLADYSEPLGEKFDLVICADVLEHVMEPDIIMKYMVDIDPRCAVLSTPARELLPEWFASMNGPPKNHTHIREWTTEEFLNYVAKWFDTQKYEVSHTASDLGVMVILKKHEKTNQ